MVGETKLSSALEWRGGPVWGRGRVLWPLDQVSVFQGAYASEL